MKKKRHLPAYRKGKIAQIHTRQSHLKVVHAKLFKNTVGPNRAKIFLYLCLCSIRNQGNRFALFDQSSVRLQCKLVV